ncbi:MAG: CRISPR-associated RAMP Cmr6 [uncultured Sulfurovum sp.]|uniref:CRISPR-associated RAMP Cmr6 n=1 Tax=uncultured Sulfurovum sp. TaxID=269237 RepID=A0A6S6TJ92_9BACT|nr:MAG: CRISPR-associated RAMP Cmr6 [uncultured Sulfurovum sp.]
MYKLGDCDEQIAHTVAEVLKISAVDESMNAKESFKLQTLYPGLLIGSGYSHGLSNNEDVKIGFYFDHTTGLPLIQGSSVKGMLRSCFGLEFGNQKDKYKEEKHEYIRDLMNQPDLDVEAFAKDIFEGVDSDSQEHEKSKMKSIYNRDIFYEARVVGIENNKSLLSKDYITPHKDKPCEEPTPLKFIKVSPEVTFEFSFDLKDSQFATAQEKEALFITLLEEFGIGAKTNVGYGQLEFLLTEEEKREKEKEAEKREKENRAKRKEEEKKKENMGLSEFEILIKELESFKKKDNNMVKKIKEYEGIIEDIEKVRKIVESKDGESKFHNRIMKHLDTLT